LQSDLSLYLAVQQAVIALRGQEVAGSNSSLKTVYGVRYCASELSQIQPRPLPSTLSLTQHSMKLCAVVAFCNVSAICLFGPAKFHQPQREVKREKSDLWVVSSKCFLWDQIVSWQTDKFYVQESTTFSLPAQNMSLLTYYQITSKYADVIFLAALHNLF